MPPSPDQFAEKLIRALRRAGLNEEIRHDRERFALEYPNGSLFLTNAYAEYQRASFFGRGAVLRRWALSVMEERTHRVPDSFAEAQANLLPYVRDAAYFDYIRLMQKSESDRQVQPFPSRPLGGDLLVAVAYDTPRTINTLAHKVLDGWGVSLDEALKTAQFNLRARTPEGLARQAPGLFVSPYRDSHDASRIVLTEVISRLEVRGDPVALVPHRDALIVTGSDDPEGLTQACTLAEPLVKENRRLSGTALVFRRGKWEPFLPPPGSPSYEGFRRLRMLALLADYGQQQELLQKLEGESVYVCPYTVVEKDGTWLSYSVWSEGVPTSLPITDKVALNSERFAKGDPMRALRDWSDVEREAGPIMERQAFHPDRVMVREFPTDEMLARIERGPGG